MDYFLLFIEVLQLMAKDWMMWSSIHLISNANRQRCPNNDLPVQTSNVDLWWYS